MSAYEKTLLAINAIVCLIAALRLIFFKRGEKKHDSAASIFAYILAIAFVAVPVRILVGEYNGAADIAEVLINIALMIALIKSGGNVAVLLKPLKTRKEKGENEWKSHNT